MHIPIKVGIKYTNQGAPRHNQNATRAGVFPLLGVLKSNRKKLDHQTRHALARLTSSLARDMGYEKPQELPTARRMLVQRAVAKHCALLRWETQGLTKGKKIPDITHYIGLANSLRMDLALLGLDRTARDISSLEAIRRSLKGDSQRGRKEIPIDVTEESRAITAATTDSGENDNDNAA